MAFGQTIKNRIQQKQIKTALRINAKKQKEDKKKPVSHYIDPDRQAKFDSYYFGGEFAELCIQLCEETKRS